MIGGEFRRVKGRFESPLAVGAAIAAAQPYAAAIMELQEHPAPLRVRAVPLDPSRAGEPLPCTASASAALPSPPLGPSWSLPVPGPLIPRGPSALPWLRVAVPLPGPTPTLLPTSDLIPPDPAAPHCRSLSPEQPADGNVRAHKGDGVKKTLSVEHIYQKKTQLEHILLRPDTYIGSVEMVTQVRGWG